MPTIDPIAIKIADSIPQNAAARDSLVAEWVRQQYAIDIQSEQGANQIYELFALAGSHPISTITACLIFAFILRLIYIYMFRGDKRIKINHLRLSKRLERATVALCAVMLLGLSVCDVSEDLHVGNEHNVDVFFLSVFTIATSVFILSVSRLLSLAFKKKDDMSRRRKYNGLIISGAVAAFSLGFAVYFIGMYASGTQRSMLAAILRPAIASGKLFLLSDSVGDLSTSLRESGVFMGVHSLSCLFSAIISATAIILAVKARYGSYKRLKKLQSRDKDIYVFYGCNQRTTLLTDDIMKNRKDGITLWIDNENTEKDEINELSLSGLSEILTSGSSRHQEATRHGATLIASETQEIGEGMSFEQMGLGQLKRLINDNPRSVSFFFLSSDAESNFNNCRRLANSRELKGVGNTTIYSHVPITPSTQIAEEGNDGVNIKLLDSSRLSARTLQMTEDNEDCSSLPVYHVKNEKGGVTTPFKAMIIGFGESGLAAFKFLYENSSFKGESADAPSETEFYCVDSHIEERRREFNFEMPGLKGDPSIKFLNYDIKSAEFADKAESLIGELNYIVIAAGDDDISQDVALKIFSIATKKLDKNHKLHIYVRNYKESKRHAIKELFDFYNSREDQCDISLRLYGSDYDIFTETIVCVNRPLEEAIQFTNAYNDIYLRPEDKDFDKLWKNRHDKMCNTPDPSIYTLRDLRRQENQDFSNSLHVRTKIFLSGELVGWLKEAADKSHRVWTSEYVEELCKEIDSPERPTLQIVENLAITEHIRWIASHKTLGYVYGDTKDSRKMTHPCMKPWSEIPEYQIYDFKVVYTSLAIYLNSIG